MSRRIRVIVQYDGTNYVGWQVQENGISVQQRLNDLVYMDKINQLCAAKHDKVFIVQRAVKPNGNHAVKIARPVHIRQT